MAEWSYLWLQKQHLYGIERSEAIQYMLEGAAARTDNTVKNQCIEVALKKSQIDAGILGPDVTPTRAYQRMATNTPSAAAGRRMSFGVLNNPISATPTSAGGNGAVSNGFAVSPANQSASSMVLPAMTPLLAAENSAYKNRNPNPPSRPLIVSPDVHTFSKIFTTAGPNNALGFS
jgi:hypothetical protein